uniref:Putative secreted protein n=1 Tax=Rhipicephalus microplus TaxID=6941 RepID=A0A6G4ZYP2_RHIMP
MTLFQFLEGFLITFVVFSACKGDTDEQNYESLFADSESTSSPCADLNRAAPFEDLLLHPTNNRISPQELLEMRMASRVCLPEPCGHLKAYSGLFLSMKTGLRICSSCSSKPRKNHGQNLYCCGCKVGQENRHSSASSLRMGHSVSTPPEHFITGITRWSNSFTSSIWISQWGRDSASTSVKCTPQHLIRRLVTS